MIELLSDFIVGFNARHGAGDGLGATIVAVWLEVGDVLCQCFLRKYCSKKIWDKLRGILN